jgi:hypothetical protein
MLHQAVSQSSSLAKHGRRDARLTNDDLLPPRSECFGCHPLMFDETAMLGRTCASFGPKWIIPTAGTPF